jgi:hypothetical protein
MGLLLTMLIVSVMLLCASILLLTRQTRRTDNVED